MLRNNKKLMMLATAAIIAVPISMASAATTNIDAVAVFLDAITLNGEVNMDFDIVEFSAAPAAGDHADLGTNGTIAYLGNFSGGGTGVAGSVTIATGTNGQIIEVFCDTTATMTDGAGASIDVVLIEAAAQNVTGTFAGAGSVCNGVAGAAATNLTMNGGVLDTFKFGGRVDGATAAAFVAGSYSTAFAGGDDVQVDIFYQ